MPESSKPSVFYDPKQKRASWISRFFKLLGAVATVILAIFFVSVLAAPALPAVPGLTAPFQRVLRPALPRIPTRQKRLTQHLYESSRDELLAHIVKEHERESRRRAAAARRGLPTRAGSVVAAFYGTWQETGLYSLRAHAHSLTHLMPEWVHLTPDGGALDLHDFDPTLTPHNKDVLQIAADHDLAVMPVFNNGASGSFDTLRAHLLLSDPAKQQRVARALRDWLAANHFAGINVNLESLRPGDYAHLPGFLKRLRAELAPGGMQVSVDIEAESKHLSWPETAAAADLVILMAYDEHASEDDAGAIASLGWYQTVLERAHREIPADKLIVGLGSYGYDWPDGVPHAENLSYQEAIFLAQDNHPGEPPGKVVDFDDKLLNPTFRYVDDKGGGHEVWMMDAVTAANQWLLAQKTSARGAALWVLGQEDPSIWSFFDRRALAQPIDMAALGVIAFPYDVQFIGQGEVLQVATAPRQGLRTLEVDPTTGLAVDEEYVTFPASILIKRRGFKKQSLAITVDDGPDPEWTPPMLDELARLKVPATFFMLGQNIERNPDLVQRVWSEGHEIGNHSFTHPNLGAASDLRIKLELNATQRALQSVIGRSTLLFRPPYNADAEPTSAEEVRPITIAADLGYLTVAEFIDPQDWNLTGPLDDEANTGVTHRRTAADIAAEVVKQVHEGAGNTILIHDAGGDRSETVKALAIFVPALQREGYQFVAVSSLLDSTRDAVMPPVSDRDAFLRGTDRIVFEASYLIAVFLRIAFVTAIFLGVGRVAIIIVLALISWLRERGRRWDEDYRPAVSVLIAAYNEEQGHRADDPHGPRGRLSAARGHRGGRRLQGRHRRRGRACLRGRRARARRPAGERRQGLRAQPRHRAGAATRSWSASTPTRSSPPTRSASWCAASPTRASRRWRATSRSATASTCWTHWQSIEYITARTSTGARSRMLNAITVVPGAIGAWRREVVLECGGYQHRHAGRGHGSDLADPPQGLEDRQRAGGLRLHRGARQRARAGQTALPLGLRHAAVSVEAPGRARPLRLLRPGRAAHAVGVPDVLPGAVPAGGPADPVDGGADRLAVGVARGGLARVHAAAERDRRALQAALHVRPVLHSGAGGGRGRVPARPRAAAPAVDAVLATLRVPPAHVLRRPTFGEDGALGRARQLEQARAQGHGGARMIARFAGLWIDEGGRALWIEADGEAALVSVAPGVAEPCYQRPPLLGHVRRGRTLEMPAALAEDGRLRVEAGSPGLGPIYDLTFEGDQLSPSVHLGLYDDFEDDLGVPWALPLSLYRRATPAEEAVWVQSRP